jgi:chemotaxis protein methyltransferase CheR
MATLTLPDGALDPSTLAHLTENDFRRVQRMLSKLSGMNLLEGKEDLVKARLQKRLRATKIKTFKEYLDTIEAEPSGAETRNFIDVLTTNLTSFFREKEHFDFIASEILPRQKNRSLTIWSAGCSTGEEPYSISMFLLETLPDPGAWDIRILATDISTRVLAHAQEGVFPKESVSSLSPAQRQRHFQECGGVPPTWRISPATAAPIRFARLNLMGEWPMRGPFDLIFCRNVMIYFDKAVQERLVLRYWDLLRPGGHLLVGHSESLSGLRTPYRYVRPAVYQRGSASAAGRP